MATEGYEVGDLERLMEERGIDLPGLPFTINGDPYTCSRCGGFLKLYRFPEQTDPRVDVRVFQDAKHDVCPLAA